MNVTKIENNFIASYMFSSLVWAGRSNTLVMDAFIVNFLADTDVTRPIQNLDFCHLITNTVKTVILWNITI